jgi:predicted RNA-binding Zn ribbon-like protein
MNHTYTVSAVADAYTAWEQEHFIGGHPALDLANTVFDRRAPSGENDLLNSARDVTNWLCASCLIDRRQAKAIADVADPSFLDEVREIREACFSIFNAIATGESPQSEALGCLFVHAGNGLTAGSVERADSRVKLTHSHRHDPHAVAPFLAMLSIDASFVLPQERIHSCPRCGWLFADTSRGGRRRWCSMRTCGNREKVSRHRQISDA